MEALAIVILIWSLISPFLVIALIGVNLKYKDTIGYLVGESDIINLNKEEQINGNEM